ncbi:MAG: hypothetical protein IJ506_03295 [Clostridia bacterium]|nr:hypothetical protein [Clostridia bacterium]
MRARTRRKRRVARRFSVHPLFFLVGIWFCFIGKLPLFLMSALVALQHECAHAFAAARLGYRLNRVVLMPYGAVIDGDLKKLSFKDEFTVAIWGPLANLLTAGFFVALWWLYPTAYAFTDTACYTSLSVALVNLLPAYPLDGGRILKSALVTAFENAGKAPVKAEKYAGNICRGITFFLSALLLALFIVFAAQGKINATLLLFALFLLFGGIGNGKEGAAIYGKLDFSFRDAFERGAEIKRYAVSASGTVKDALRFLSKGNYLVLELYGDDERYLGTITQNRLFEAFERESLYAPLGKLLENTQKSG